MNVTFNGYLTLTCNGCSKKLTVESRELSFQEDTSSEAEDDNYIRYVTQVDTHCSVCSTKLHVKLDVWEYPEAVANYSYHGAQGASDIQCEFNIEHYFDDEAGSQTAAPHHESSDKKTHTEDENSVEDENEPDFDENDSEENDTKFNESAGSDRYEDLYDDDN